MIDLKPCLFCGGKVKFLLLDDEFTSRTKNTQKTRGADCNTACITADRKRGLPDRDRSRRNAGNVWLRYASGSGRRMEQEV